MIEKNTKRVNYFGLCWYCSLHSGKTLNELTKDELVELMFGNAYNDYSGNFIVKSYDSYSKRTVWNRLNLLWIYPLFLVAIPFQYLITGDTGVNRNTKFGRIVDWLVKFE